MAIYFKFRSEKLYCWISVDEFISVGDLKQRIFESKYKASKGSSLCMGTDFDLMVINAQTNEAYATDSTLVPPNTSLLLQRIPGDRRGCRALDTTPIVVTESTKNPNEEIKKKVASASTGSSSTVTYGADDTEWSNDFGNDVYAIPSELPTQSGKNLSVDREDDKDTKIKALANPLAMDFNGSGFASQDGNQRGFRRMGGSGFGGLQRQMPPQGYVCHRCNKPGHFIQHCPTNRDPNYDFKRMNAPTKSMPSRSSKVSSRASGSILPELLCPLCKHIMKDAVLTGKCCFRSFCDKCIKDYLIASKCLCGATGIVADNLVPNITLRDTIKRILESDSSSSSNTGNAQSAFQVQDVEFSHCQQQSFTLSAAQLKQDKKPSQVTAEAPKTEDAKALDESEVKLMSMNVKETASHRIAPVVKEKVQQKNGSSEAAKKKRKRESHQGEAADSYMMPVAPYAYYSYWNAMHPGMESYMAP